MELPMAQRSNKHINKRGQAISKQVVYPSFDGGLNLAVPPESLKQNELREALNVEFSPETGAMTVRGGIVSMERFDNSVDYVLPIPDYRGFILRKKNSKVLYAYCFTRLNEIPNRLTGTGDISIVAWEDYYLVASGGKLQKLLNVSTSPALETISNSPSECRYVFVRNGRVGVVSDDDTLTFSWVGDCTKWDNNPEDESTGQFVEIGYKDGMNIDVVVPLSRDLIIFKSPENNISQGIIWRLTGNFPDWQVLEVAHNTGTLCARTTQIIGNDIVYITLEGITSLSNVTEYGDVKTSWPDRKVSAALTPLLDKTAQLWAVPLKQQLWVLPSEREKRIWVFDYMRKIWTQFEFANVLIYAAGIGRDLYVFSARNIYRLSQWNIYDEYDNGTKRTSKTITGKLRLGTLMSSMQTLIKGAYVSFNMLSGYNSELQRGCNGELRLGNFVMPLTSTLDTDYIYDAPNDTDEAYEDDDPLFSSSGVMTARRRCIVRDWAITPEIIINGGGCSVSSVGLETVEV